MANNEELRALDVAELAEKFRAHQLSPVDVTDAYLARIAATEPRLHAYITVTAEFARGRAQCRSGNYGRQMAGAFPRVPIGITPDKAPLSFQIIGRPFDEIGILRVADAYERARGPLPPPNF